MRTSVILAAALLALAGLPAHSASEAPKKVVPKAAPQQMAAAQKAAPPQAAPSKPEPQKVALEKADVKADAAKPDPLLDGARSFQRADYRAALASWQPLALHGNPVAQNNLGILYLDGKGVPQNNSEAVRYLSLSAVSGSSLGQNNLGGLYRDGKGVPRDYARAAQWFTASAGQGNSAGMYNLGLMYELGQGTKAEPFHAYMWYALAAEQNNIPNAAAHRDALWARMTPAAQKQAHDLAVACKQQAFKGCK